MEASSPKDKFLFLNHGMRGMMCHIIAQVECVYIFGFLDLFSTEHTENHQNNFWLICLSFIIMYVYVYKGVDRRETSLKKLVNHQL